MTLRLTAYLMICALATMTGCHSYHPRSYVSLEGFPDVHVVKARILQDAWMGLGVLAPVEYVVERHDYHLRIFIDEAASMPTAFVEVYSTRPGIGLLPDDRSDDSCLMGHHVRRTEGDPHKRLKFEGRCAVRPQRLSMRFHVLDAKGRIADESIPYRIYGGALYARIDSI